MTRALAIVIPTLPQAATAAPATAIAIPRSRRIEELTHGMATGSEDAFREFHRRYFDRLLRFALVLTRGDQAAASDVLQETLCRLVRHARQFKDEEVFWCWLCALARSAARDCGRKRQRYLALLEDYARRWLPLQSQPAADADEERLDDLAGQCLGELDAFDRALVEGKYFDRLSVRELAVRVELTEKAVESRLGRLRQHLRARLLDRLREDSR